MMMKTSKTRELLRAVAVFAICALLASCAPKKEHWHTDDINGMMPKLSFNMTDDSGRAVSAQTYHGKTVLLFFGYTNCADVCPTTLATLAQALKDTKSHGSQMKVLFVTVDPKRDTLAKLHAYVRAFGPWFVGLRGGTDALQAFTKRYRVTYSYGKADKAGDYEVSHSSAVFVFDGTGRSRLLIQPTDPAKAITADLDQLAAEAGA